MSKWASDMTDDEIAAELACVDARIAKGFGEHGGSPGEWWYERADELVLAQTRRAALREPPEGGGEK